VYPECRRRNRGRNAVARPPRSAPNASGGGTSSVRCLALRRAPLRSGTRTSPRSLSLRRTRPCRTGRLCPSLLAVRGGCFSPRVPVLERDLLVVDRPHHGRRRGELEADERHAVLEHLLVNVAEEVGVEVELVAVA